MKKRAIELDDDKIHDAKMLIEQALKLHCFDHAHATYDDIVRITELPDDVIKLCIPEMMDFSIYVDSGRYWGYDYKTNKIYTNGKERRVGDNMKTLQLPKQLREIRLQDYPVGTELYMVPWALQSYNGSVYLHNYTPHKRPGGTVQLKVVLRKDGAVDCTYLESASISDHSGTPPNDSFPINSITMTGSDPKVYEVTQ